jgi:hypothetical protein
MGALARANGSCKRQTHPLVREDVTITARIQLESKIIGRESQGACRQDELLVVNRQS